ncbi:hypothetical protein KFE25_009641 [Diacronema lutheri]|uniref:START domain-containing protein n=1 Tax=Diacronema lutheri TaxID=2081491 RepID=A0A8J5Y3Z1_DIALT|nr:hypothetical protein KFE25_009641 [Diacronema lutheri]
MAEPNFGGGDALRPAQLGEAIDHAVFLAEERRYIEAGLLLERVRAFVDGRPARSALASRARLDTLLARGGALELVEARRRTAERALVDLRDDDGWVLYADRHGQRTRYRRANGVLSIKIDATVDGIRPADAFFIWREASLFRHWSPLISRSAMLHDFHPAEVALHLEIDLPALVHADLALHGWGCVHLREAGAVLICVRPLEQTALPTGVTIPPPPSARRTFPPQRVPAHIDICVEPRSPTSVHFTYAVSYPLHPAVPTWAMNIILGQGMADLFAKMRAEAVKMAAGDVAASVHLARMREPSGKAAARWLSDRIDPFVASLGQPGGAAGEKARVSADTERWRRWPFR